MSWSPRPGWLKPPTPEAPKSEEVKAGSKKNRENCLCLIRNPYERYYWHYDSRRPLSMAQIIALKSVDAETVALIWLLLEHGASLTVAGPTDPQPGVGKTTTLNALLQFLPEGTALAYMSGMYENFAFTREPDIDPAATYALCNEVSNHLPIYMWGRIRAVT